MCDRPRIVLLADRPGWAFSQIARALVRRLSHRYRFRVVHREVERPALHEDQLDLLYVFFWGDDSYQSFGIPPEKIVKEVASYRWALEEQYGQFSLERFVETYLSDCAWVTTPCRRLYQELRGARERVLHCPNGVELDAFRPTRRRSGPLRIGWVGNPADACKGLDDVLVPACEGRFALEATDGKRSRREVVHLYNRCDVIAIASTAESQPLPLLEGMACGAFPVATDVGIVPELVRSGTNGLVVERSPEAFRDAFAWCAERLSHVRRAGAFNAELIARERSWDQLAHRFGELFDGALGRGPAPSPAATPVTDVRAEAPRPERLRRALSRGQIPLRIAFLTPEFVTEYDTGGGLGNYLRRMTQALLEAGHVPEVFVLSRGAPGPIDFEGVRVMRVRRSDANPVLDAGVRLSWRLGLHRFQPPLLLLNDARRLASALERRDAERRFDLVQSADYLACGAFVRSIPGRPHLVRCSADGRLWADANGDTSPRRRWETWLERASLRRADLAYAPSRFVADQLQRRYGIEVQVLRPPVALECKPRRDESHDLPERYFIHFGQLAGSKGTLDLARALPRVWEQEPAFAMVWAGPDRTGRLREWWEAWGPQRSRVTWLGELTKPELYAVLAEAAAAVLPSRVDNLPNTAIESLLLGVPVIGSAGASIDELVEPGVTGELVPIGDAEALAAAMLRLWRGQSTARRGFRWNSPLAEEMRPENAVRNLLRLAGLGSET